MADKYEGLDVAELEEKLAAAEGYEERAAIRKALRSRKKDRGEATSVTRRGASVYNRFRSSTTSTAPKQQHHFVPATATGGGGGGRKSPSVTPARSGTPSSSHSPTPQTPTSPLPPSSLPTSSPSPLPEKEPLPDVAEDRAEGKAEEEVVEVEEKEEVVEEEEELVEEEENKEEEEKEEEEEPQAAGSHEAEEEPAAEAESPAAEEHPAPPKQAEEWVMVDKRQARRLERETRADQQQVGASPRGREQTDGGSPFGVQLRSRGTSKPSATPPSGGRAGAEPSKAEFQGFKLRKTPSQTSEERPSQRGRDAVGRSREETRTVTAAPRTLADYQKLTSKPGGGGGEIPPGPTAKYHEHLVSYVNTSLQLVPTIPSGGSALYETCCNPTIICKLINKSVRNTVDMRALTKTPPPSKTAECEEALQENMTLAVESARAIGCAVNDATEYNLLQKDAETIRRLLIDLIRARLVHIPGMEDEPSSTFTDLPLMMKRLGLSAEEEEEEEEADAADDGEEEVSQQPRSWREADNEALRKEVEAPEPAPESTNSSWREPPTSTQQQPAASVDLNKPSLDDNLSYEERAALRRAERERRRREREAIATAK